jgi:hypothetical protein
MIVEMKQFGDKWSMDATRAFYDACAPLLHHALESVSPRVLTDDIPRLPYTETKSIVTMASHVGQLKLLLSEIEFLTNHPTARFCIYAGSAPSHKGAMLAELFPHIRFIFIDPCEHFVKYGNKSQYDDENRDDFLYFSYAGASKRSGLLNWWDGKEAKIVARQPSGQAGCKDYRSQLTSVILSMKYRFYILEEYFDDDLAHNLAILPYTVFISDIRSKAEDDAHPTTFDILFNSAQMYTWLEILDCPAMTKFRCPYTIDAAEREQVAADYKFSLAYIKRVFTECSVDYIGNFAAGFFIHAHGEIRLQAFAPPSSTETRLVTNGRPIAIQYDCTKYEQQLFYLNKVGLYSPGNYRLGLSAEQTEKIDALGMCICANCTAAFRIIAEYCRGPLSTITDPCVLLQRCMELTGRTFNVAGHGIYLSRIAAGTPTTPSPAFYSLLQDTLNLRNKRLIARAPRTPTPRARVIPQTKEELRELQSKQYNDALDLLG